MGRIGQQGKSGDWELARRGPGGAGSLAPVALVLPLEAQRAAAAGRRYVELENREVAMEACNNQSYRLRRWGAETLMRAMTVREVEWPAEARMGALWKAAREAADAIGAAVDSAMMQESPGDGALETVHYAWLLKGKQEYIVAIFARAAEMAGVEG